MHDTGVAADSLSWAPSDEQELDIKIIFTSPDATAAALRAARDLAVQLNARLTIWVPEVVPIQLPLDYPQVSVEFLEQRIQELVVGLPEDLRVRILLCREKVEALLGVLEPRSLVVIGGREHWWPTEEVQLARRLQRNSHHVVFVSPE